MILARTKELENQLTAAEIEHAEDQARHDKTRTFALAKIKFLERAVAAKEMIAANGPNTTAATVEGASRIIAKIAPALTPPPGVSLRGRVDKTDYELLQEVRVENERLRQQLAAKGPAAPTAAQPVAAVPMSSPEASAPARGGPRALHARPIRRPSVSRRSPRLRSPARRRAARRTAQRIRVSRPHDCGQRNHRHGPRSSHRSQTRTRRGRCAAARRKASGGEPRAKPLPRSTHCIPRRQRLWPRQPVCTGRI